MKQITIKNQILFIVIILSTLTGFVAFQGNFALDDLNKQLNTLVTVESKKINLSQKMRVTLLEMHRAEKNMIAASSIPDMDEYQSNFDDYAQHFKEFRENLRKLVDVENQGKLDRIGENYQKYLSVFENVVNLTRNKDNKEAKELSVGKARTLINDIEHLLMEISEFNDKSMDETVSATNRLYEKTRNQQILFSLFGIILGVSIGLFFLRILK